MSKWKIDGDFHVVDKDGNNVANCTSNIHNELISNVPLMMDFIGNIVDGSSKYDLISRGIPEEEAEKIIEMWSKFYDKI